MTTMETDRLILRPWHNDDQVELERLWSDVAVKGERNLPPERIAAISESSLRQWRVRLTSRCRRLRAVLLATFNSYPYRTTG